MSAKINQDAELRRFCACLWSFLFTPLWHIIYLITDFVITKFTCQSWVLLLY